jgi:hypothetical protein
VKRAAIAAGLILVILVAGVVAALLWFPAPLLRASLRAAGVEAVAFDKLQLGSNGVELTGLRLGASANQRLARLQIHYHPTDLLRGRIDRIDLEGLDLSGRIADGGIELDGWRTGSGTSGGAFDLAALPRPEQIVLRAAKIRLATPWGELEMPLSGVPGGGLACRVQSRGRRRPLRQRRRQAGCRSRPPWSAGARWSHHSPERQYRRPPRHHCRGLCPGRSCGRHRRQDRHHLPAVRRRLQRGDWARRDQGRVARAEARRPRRAPPGALAD